MTTKMTLAEAQAFLDARAARQRRAREARKAKLAEAKELVAQAKGRK